MTYPLELTRYLKLNKQKYPKKCVASNHNLNLCQILEVLVIFLHTKDVLFSLCIYCIVCTYKKLTKNFIWLSCINKTAIFLENCLNNKTTSCFKKKILLIFLFKCRWLKTNMNHLYDRIIIQKSLLIIWEKKLSYQF